MSEPEETAAVKQDSTECWSVLAANAVGASHQASGRPGQDAYNFAPSAHTTDRLLAVAVADGHGHRIHFRSKVGARVAVDVACNTVLGAAEVLAACHGVEEVGAYAQEELLPRVVRAWRQACMGDLEARPVTEDELEAVGFPEEERAAALVDDDPLLAYGSTLMFAGLAGPWLLLAHIGDGDIFTIGVDGTAAQPVPGDPLLDGQRTTSLCQADALGSFRIAVLDVSEHTPAVVALATDGYGNAQNSDDWQPGVGADLARYLRSDGRTWIGQQLADWVSRCASVEGSGDDTTMALLISPGAEQRARAVTPALPGRSGTEDNGRRSAAATLLPAPGNVAALASARERTLPMAPSEAPAFPVGSWPTSPGSAPGSALPHPREATGGSWGWPANASSGQPPATPPGPPPHRVDPRLRGRMLWVAAGALAVLVAVIVVVIVMTTGSSANKNPGVVPLLPGASSTVAPGSTLPATPKPSSISQPTSTTGPPAETLPDSGQNTAGQAGSNVGSVATTGTSSP